MAGGFSAVFVIFQLAVVYAQLPEFLGSRDVSLTSSKIVGGTRAPDGIAPYQVSLRSLFNSHFCSGAILDDRWILTAAHCLDWYYPKSIVVVVGTNELDRGGDEYRGETKVLHKNYTEKLVKNDIALLRVASPIIFNSKVRPIELAVADTPSDADLVLTGWGRRRYPGSVAVNLQILKLRSLSFEDCHERLAHYKTVYPNQICTLTKRGEGACHGDSGGPLIENGRLVGIVSWGVPCAMGFPDVHTRVFAFLDWVLEITQTGKPIKNLK